MLCEPPADSRSLRIENLACDLAVIGGGLSGLCAAITAARTGTRVVLIQDRPVLGGNGSSEIRLWALGATSHMGNNNRWAREGGVIDEILVENLFRNPEGNPLIFDSLLLEKVVDEPNITLLLNTAVYQVSKSQSNLISSVRAFCSQNSTEYIISAPLFCDASGDGIVGFLAGAAFRIGAEAQSQHNEGLAAQEPSMELLGHTIYFYTKDAGRPVRYVPPKFALQDITKIPRWREIAADDHGCSFWWLEWGGAIDTVHDTETIKWELWKVVYGLWDYVKNSNEFPSAKNKTLEWIGAIPGKRESRRFEGDYMLTQLDIVGQSRHFDAVSFGGWAIDLHPVDGVYSENPPCTQWHSKGMYQIPYRCLFSRNIDNLFLTGRLISATHVAFGSTRVMLTCAHNGQAVGMAAALCVKKGLRPRDILQASVMKELQKRLLRTGQFIPDMIVPDEDDLAQKASVTASSELRLASLPPNGETLLLDQPSAMMLPIKRGSVPSITVGVDVLQETELQVELRASDQRENHTPNVILAKQTLTVLPGKGQEITIDFKTSIGADHYLFFCLMPNDSVFVHLSDVRITGILSVTRKAHKSVTKSSTQIPPPHSGIDQFEFWTPQRRPGGKNLAITITPGLDAFAATNLINGVARPTCGTNAWVSDERDTSPTVTLQWDQPQRIGSLELAFDTDYDHPMESVQMGHPESEIPFCVRHIRVRDAKGTLIAERVHNHQSRLTISLVPIVSTDRLHIECVRPCSDVSAALFEIRCYE